MHQTMIAQWKRQAIKGMAATFSGRSTSGATARPADVEKLHAKIGQLLVERDFLRDASVRPGVIRGGKYST
ncbi:transposase [Komagataeibacter intermedius NRIC 0521]|nr:transposase [Komagataeibacter intermedius NRIC 0521]